MPKLVARAVEKTWGREDIPAHFDVRGGQIGEIWFEGGEALPLLVKYLFTSEPLSIQVHPDDRQAHAFGLTGGKEEAWYILDCAPDARLGLGLLEPMSPQAFRAAAIDGSLEHRIDWKPVRPGDCYFVPAGTVHAIGGGITLVEVQQNVDVTYRLFDYGRPRELHLDQGIAASRLEPYVRSPVHVPLGQAQVLLDGTDSPFSMELGHWTAGQVLPTTQGPVWFVPLAGKGRVNGASWRPGDVWLLDPADEVLADRDAAGLLARTA
ncbi:type I phosphomannose isomerase catalytic subunit [Sphingobium rhizovicinum]|uniref:Type I phosphomannose isomerase catalytic subunit n=1 Tax=Sphingobium rhizovicinum TaxID=432308 RepID=A0ABV7NDM1_9SPHN